MISKDAANVPQSERTAERLRSFMSTHELSLSELAELLRTSPETLEEWLDSGSAPPAWLLALMILLPIVPKGKGLRYAASEPVPDCFSSRLPAITEAREEALRRVRAI